MSDELVRQLKAGLPCHGDECKVRDERACMCFKAGATIERLTAQVAALREALQGIADRTDEAETFYAAQGALEVKHGS